MVHSITLATGDSEIATNDVLGRLNYAAPGEAQTGDARLIGASITAVAEGAFTTSANATKLVFSTGASETAAEKMSLSSAGVLTLTGAIELGHASDTTLARASSGDLNVEGNLIYRAGGTDVPVADGGTGASTLTDGGILLGSGTGAITALAVLGDGVIVVGDNSTDPTTITAFTASDGVLKHEVGGLELDISGIAIGDVLAGTGTGAVGIVTSTGHSDGDVLTLQADGTADWESAGGGSARSVAGDTNNGIVTWVTSDDTFAVESSLSFTGGDLIVGGSTPSVTIGDAGTEDTKLVFDGAAQDFYIGLDDTDDDLKIGLGSAVGTTPVITMAGAGAVNFGVDDTGYDVTMYGATSGSYFRWDESADGVRLVASNFVQEQVPASNAGTAVSDDSDATINIDWSRGNYHWIVLAEANVTKIIFQNMKRGGRYILRIEQHASSAKTVAWTNVDSDESNTAFTEVRWVGGTAPTMSTGTGRVDVYGFLCTRSNGRGVDGFVIAQNLAEDGTH